MAFIFLANNYFALSPNRLLLIMMLALVFNFLVYHFFLRLLPDWVKQKDITGTILFSGEEIIVKHENKSDHINLNSIRQIDLHSDAYCGKRLGKYYRCNGISEIRLTDDSGVVFNFRYFIKNKNQFEQLSDILGLWYKKHFPIHEKAHNNNLMCFLMDVGYSYSEIQRLKKQYDAS